METAWELLGSLQPFLFWPNHQIWWKNSNMLFSDEEKEDVFMMKEGYKFSGWLGGV